MSKVPASEDSSEAGDRTVLIFRKKIIYISRKGKEKMYKQKNCSVPFHSRAIIQKSQQFIFILDSFEIKYS